MKENDQLHKYDDILYLPHPVSKKHPPMSLHDRAAQFSPFAALTGHGDSIRETARRTRQKMELDEYQLAKLDDKLQWLREHLSDKPYVRILYFQPDERKEGGAYLTREGVLKKIDAYKRRLQLYDGTLIDMMQISEITVVGLD